MPLAATATATATSTFLVVVILICLSFHSSLSRWPWQWRQHLGSCPFHLASPAGCFFFRNRVAHKAILVDGHALMLQTVLGDQIVWIFTLAGEDLVRESTPRACTVMTIPWPGNSRGCLGQWWYTLTPYCILWWNLQQNGKTGNQDGWQWSFGAFSTTSTC